VLLSRHQRAMGPVQRVVRRALNPVSTRVTMLVQGAGTRRAFGVRRGGAVPRGSATYSPAMGWLPRPGRRRWRRGGAAPVPLGEAGGGMFKADGQVAVPDVVGLSWGETPRRCCTGRVWSRSDLTRTNGRRMRWVGLVALSLTSNPNQASSCRSAPRSRCGLTGVPARQACVSRGGPILRRGRRRGWWTRSPARRSAEA
jgi:hypothetical protein